MKKSMKKSLLCFALILVLISNLIPVSEISINASDSLVPVAIDNLDLCAVTNVKTPSPLKRSYLVPNASGYMRVSFDNERKKIWIEDYNDKFMITSKRSLDLELDLWGGFYAGDDAYYIAEGQNNTEENNNKEVIRIIKYDHNWKRLGAASVKRDLVVAENSVRYPFDASSCDMIEHKGKLYLVSGHEGYVDSKYGQGHQGFLMVEVDPSSMTGRFISWDQSHSFIQFLDQQGSDMYMLDQCEGSKYVRLSKYDGSYYDGNYPNTKLKPQTISVFNYAKLSTDGVYARACRASVDGLAISGHNILTLGTSIDQSKFSEATRSTSYNIYLTVTPLDNYSADATKVVACTNYADRSDNGVSFQGTYLTKINDNRFMISWQEYGKYGKQDTTLDNPLGSYILHYMFVDENGNKLSKEYTAAAPISDCEPILKDGKVVYYASNANTVNFYSIDAQTGDFETVKSYHVAGENVSWEISDNTLTFSGKGTVSINNGEINRSSVAGLVNGQAYTDTYGWKQIKNNLTKMVFKSGITEISANAFEDYDVLTEVVIEDGMTTLNDKCFYNCDKLRDIYIPSSVTSISDTSLDSGWYTNVGGQKVPVFKVRIHAPRDSYAIQYAKEHDAKYTYTDQEPTTTSTATTTTTTAEKPGTTDSASDNSSSKPSTEPTHSSGSLSDNTKPSASTSGKINGPYTTSTKKNTDANVISSVQKQKLKITKITSPKAKTILLKWKKATETNGYQIQYATNSKFTRGRKTVIIKNRSTVSKTIKKLKRKKTYYVRIRAYKKLKGRTYFSKWSSKKIRCR